MKKSILNLGKVLTRKEQKFLQGGTFAICSACLDYCRSQNFQTKEEFSTCFYDCKNELC